MQLATDLPAEVKLLGALALAGVVVAVPVSAWPVFVVIAALVVFMLVAARVPARWVAARLALLTPFAGLALVLPFVALGERVAVGPVSVSREGAVAAGLFAARCLLAFGVALTLVSTTSMTDMTEGLARLRAPAAMVLVLNLMVRYLGVVGDDLRRMSIARASRGDGRGRIGLWVANAAGVGRLFVRSYERGERVHLAMVSRGYDGTPPPMRGAAVPGWQWLAGLAPAVVAALLAWGLG